MFVWVILYVINSSAPPRVVGLGFMDYASTSLVGFGSPPKKKEKKLLKIELPENNFHLILSKFLFDHLIPFSSR